MKHLVSMTIIFSIKIISNIFYSIEVVWLPFDLNKPWKSINDVKLVIFLNHTSLYEPVYLGAFPLLFLWKFTKKVIFPVASKTLDRPLVGFFWKVFTPKNASLTRKKDSSWHNFLNMIEDDTHVVFLPEGRMKRLTGFDLDGKKMTVRGGTSDILNKMNSGKILFMYSGGLHHLQAPGQLIPKLFKKLKLNLQLIDINEYKKSISEKGGNFTLEVAKDLQCRLENNCPSVNNCN